MTSMHGLLSPKVAAATAALALIIAGSVACTAGTETQYVNAGFQDAPPADSLQDGLAGTPQSGDPAPIVQGLTLPTTSQTGQGQGQQGNGNGNGNGNTPAGSGIDAGP